MAAATTDVQPVRGGPLMDVPETKAYLRVTSSWLYTNADKLPTLRLGKQLRWRREDLDAWLDSNRVSQ
jgi:hypothetical protein